jgi:hypothetical protein
VCVCVCVSECVCVSHKRGTRLSFATPSRPVQQAHVRGGIRKAHTYRDKDTGTPHPHPPRSHSTTCICAHLCACCCCCWVLVLGCAWSSGRRERRDVEEWPPRSALLSEHPNLWYVCKERDTNTDRQRHKEDRERETIWEIFRMFDLGRRSR